MDDLRAALDARSSLKPLPLVEARPVRQFEIDIGEFIDDHADCHTGECRIKVLPTLYSINRVIAENGRLSDALSIILDILQQRLKAERGMVTLFDRRSGKIYLHESFGLNEAERTSALFDPGEGIIGNVVESGKALIVSRDRAENPQAKAVGRKSGQDSSFLCIPVMNGRRVLGTICAERPYDNNRLLKQDFQLLVTIASMIAPAVDLYLTEHLEKRSLEHENQRLRAALKEKFKPANIIGNAKPMRELYALLEKVSATRTTVLVLGESGVGKELVASAIHHHSALAKGPFIKFNCAALPENLIESELFGHEKGSFTGATGLRKGRFELADGGTLFLDEVGELPLAAQAKLLRVLQERTFERVGGSRPITVDLRIVAATNRDLAAMVQQGSFREDLYYRLNVFPITIPPLRDRGSDIVTLADHFVALFAAAHGKEIKRISTPAIDMLMSYHWPGNVRELANVIERSVILADGGVIHGYDLPPSLQTASETGTAFGCGLEAKLQAVEYEMIVEALKAHQGNMTEAARELNLTRRILGLRMAKYQITYKSFRKGGGE